MRADLLTTTRGPSPRPIPWTPIVSLAGASVGQSSVTGTNFATEAATLKDWRSRSQRMVERVRSGSVPSFIRDQHWRWVEVKGAGHTLRYLVAPDYMSIGTADDYLVFGPTPDEGQSIADSYNAIIPSRKMVTDIRNAAQKRMPLADVKQPPENIPVGKIETVDAVLAARRIDRTRSYDPSAQLVAGHRKDIVVGPNLDGSRVAIFGGEGGTTSGWAIQPYSTIHGSYYGDYSHGLRLVSRRAFLDGTEVDLASIFTDPALHVLVSDQGPFVPRFPNTGPRATGLPLPGGSVAVGPGTGSTIPNASKPKPPSLTPASNRQLSEASLLPLLIVTVIGVGILGQAASS